MPKDALISARRRLSEAEQRLASLRDGLRVAGEQGRTHLLSTLQTMIDAEGARVEALRAEMKKSSER